MIQIASNALVIAGIIAVYLGAREKRYQFGVGFGLDLWTAAGLLKLSSMLDWRHIVIAATIIGIRHLVNYRPMSLKH